MTARALWRWILAATLVPAAAITSYGCALVGGISPPAPSTCTDGKLDGDETSIDCGGLCGACDGATCAMDAECKSGICYLSQCTPATNAFACPKNKKGDLCQACHSCGAGAACVVDADCAGGLCKANQCVQCDDTGNKCPTGPCVANCLATTCANGVMDGDETGIDCGGSCAAQLGGHACGTSTCGAAGCGAGCPALCDVGSVCSSDSDCVDKYCPIVSGNGTCQVRDHCADSMIDNLETDVDCGGPECAPCGANKHCSLGSDCLSGTCASGKCTAPAHCSDKMLNDGETDTDCGGPCPPCADKLICNDGADCQSNDCEAQTCVRCHDNKKDVDETDVDCGGGICAKCDNGKMCLSNDDCASIACVNHTCVDASCSDNVKDGLETGVDCGPGSPCKLCDGDTCTQAQPDACKSGFCDPLNQCATPTCVDGVQNGNESDVDCGGTCPMKCGTGQKCNAGGDCQALSICVAGTCHDCATACGAPCPLCGLGVACTTNTDCASDNCQHGVCRASGCILCDPNPMNGCGKCSTATCSTKEECFSDTCIGMMCH